MKSESQCFSYSLDNIHTIAQKIIQYCKMHQIIAIQGDLGAGKTTLVKKILNNLGITDSIVSPTYTYMIKYKLENGLNIYHFDLYRINKIEEFQSMGFDEYLKETNAFILIEWPEIILPALEGKYCYVTLKHKDKDMREVCITLN